MRSAPRIPRAQAIALARHDPVLAPWRPWAPVLIALGLLFAALLGR